jgi:hypothetical protein
VAFTLTILLETVTQLSVVCANALVTLGGITQIESFIFVWCY